MASKAIPTAEPATTHPAVDPTRLEHSEAPEESRATEFIGRIKSLKPDPSPRGDRGQMGARRIGALAIGIGVVGIVLNQMSDLDIVGNSTGVIDVSSIFQTAGSGLELLVVGVIIAAAAVLLQLWSGF